MKYLIIILTIAIASCSPDYSQDNRLLMYTNDIEQNMASRGYPFEIDFDLVFASRPDYIGKQTTTDRINKNNSISINKEVFDSLIAFDMESKAIMILAHEIGHGVFGLDHIVNSDTTHGNSLVVMKQSDWRKATPEQIPTMYDTFIKLIERDDTI